MTRATAGALMSVLALAAALALAGCGRRNAPANPDGDFPRRYPDIVMPSQPAPTQPETATAGNNGRAAEAGVPPPAQPETAAGHPGTAAAGNNGKAAGAVIPPPPLPPQPEIPTFRDLEKP